MLSTDEKQNRVCEAPDCSRTQYAKGYCNKHYNQIRSRGKLTPELERAEYTNGDTLCSEHGCPGSVVAKGLCMTHYQQQRRAQAYESQIEDSLEPIRVEKVRKRRAVRRRSA